MLWNSKIGKNPEQKGPVKKMSSNSLELIATKQSRAKGLKAKHVQKQGQEM